MRIHVVLEYSYEDYHGGGGFIQSVHSTREAAFAKVKELLPSKKRKKAKIDADQWDFPKEPCQDRYLTIEEYEVE